MLYVTTRNNRDAYTAQRALRESRGPDGGMYVPFREPRFTPEEIGYLSEKPINACVADVLNRLFKTKLTPWDVDFAIGRYAVRLEKLGHRVVVAECYHNLEADFSRMVSALTALLRGEEASLPHNGDWAPVGVRVAVLFGIFGELMRQGIADQNNKVDLAVVSGDFSAPISAWYARRWGLPIGNIICACNENGNLWDFICHGQLKTGDVAVSTLTPEADVVVPASLERLIFGCAGVSEVERYLDAVRRGGTYYMDESLLRRMRQGIYVTVTSQRRILDTIPSIYGTRQYILSPYSALTFAGLQDYRARTGESRTALLLAEKSPQRDADVVANALGISEEMLKHYLE